mmetsp:Transcript_23947/g.59190  ORF Transcript_23947/g.59190 Transcript_23947/m.59190 type:complete len:215 (+) Transcript_23947:638-1282(+)
MEVRHRLKPYVTGKSVRQSSMIERSLTSPQTCRSTPRMPSRVVLPTTRPSVPQPKRFSESWGSRTRLQVNNEVRDGNCSSPGRGVVNQVLPRVEVCVRRWDLTVPRLASLTAQYWPTVPYRAFTLPRPQIQGGGEGHCNRCGHGYVVAPIDEVTSRFVLPLAPQCRSRKDGCVRSIARLAETARHRASTTASAPPPSLLRVCHLAIAQRVITRL